MGRRKTEAVLLRECTQRVRAEAERIRNKKETVAKEIRRTIRFTYTNHFRPALMDAAEDGDSRAFLPSATFRIYDNTDGLEDYQEQTLIEALTEFLQAEGFSVQADGGDSHGAQPGLVVSWG